jgi:hypothetical protein
MVPVKSLDEPQRLATELNDRPGIGACRFERR